MRKVAPEQLHEVWSAVREGLEEVAKNANDGWIPEDVYLSLKTGGSLLYVWDDKSFVVLNVMQSYAGQREAHIWAAYGVGNVGSMYSPFVDDVAKDLGCSAITFLSPRKGWAKNRLGYEEVHTLYRKKLS